MKPLIITLCFFICCQLCGAQADSTRSDISYTRTYYDDVSIAVLTGYNYYGRSGVERLRVLKKRSCI